MYFYDDITSWHQFENEKNNKNLNIKPIHFKL